MFLSVILCQSNPFCWFVMLVTGPVLWTACMLSMQYLVYRWYTQLNSRQFVYDTYKTMKATRSHHGWVHMFITHCLQLNLQLHNFDLFRTCLVQVVSALLHGNWQDFNWHDASRGPLAIAEHLVSLARRKWLGFTHLGGEMSRVELFEGHYRGQMSRECPDPSPAPCQQWVSKLTILLHF